MLWSAINISEGKNLEGLHELARQLRETDAKLADWSADPDHHRAVFSLVGTPSQLPDAIERIFVWANENIDLRRHEGEHPRLGAVDVVPFVPLSSDATAEDADHLAHSLAEHIANKFTIPIFLYRDSGQLTLPEIRRGGAARLRERMEAGELKPTFGPSLPHPSQGVSVFGARTALVAFNCITDSTDLETAKLVAKDLRAANGGIPHLQTLAFPLASRGGVAQISMNILDPRGTPPHIAFLAVSQACAQRGMEVVSAELIGLVPQRALEDAFRHFLKLESFHSGQVAEWNLHHHHHLGEE